MANPEHRTQDSSRAPGERGAEGEASRRRRSSSGRAEKTAQEQLLEGVQQVWLAGMGAVARAQRDGPAAFQDAVVEGLRLLNQSRSVAQRMIRDAFETAQDAFERESAGQKDTRGSSGTGRDGNGASLQGHVQRVMSQLGVPTADDLRRLSERVADLDADVRRMDARGRRAAASAPEGGTVSGRGRQRTSGRSGKTSRRTGSSAKGRAGGARQRRNA